MNAATRAASTSAIAALVLAAAWLFWPAQLGGSTTYVTTHGVSMEPGFSTGDLAVLRPADSYEVGDVAAYYSETLDTVVMHRIVAVEGDRFVFQGDNNDWLDQDRPTADELLGTLFRQVPQGGKVLAAIASPWSLALVLAGIFGVFGNHRRKRPGRKAPRHRAARALPAVALPSFPSLPSLARPSLPRPASPALPASFSMPTRAQARQVAVGAGAVALLAAGSGVLLLGLPSTETEARSQPVTQQGTFTYAGPAEVGTTYPTGAVTTGDPVYTKLVDALTVSFAHTVDAPGLDTVDGSVRLDLSVATSDGWSAPLASGRPAPVVGRHGHRVGRAGPHARRRPRRPAQRGDRGHRRLREHPRHPGPRRDRHGAG
ncbi:signal peptidase I [Blastococcus sp. TML/C7B]|uniref:signal peptidase I n=1 Tax=Blastococcus sp. TML/C7B TaxID=2798728 RepID=UPI00190B2043|nr:signal peptidase I [Blastococcus sp. TML/C7B]MBN1095332.1 signal peptidase I [Blastococcus sp. TML/C7B]